MMTVVNADTAQRGSELGGDLRAGWMGPLDVPSKVLPWAIIAVAAQIAVNLGAAWPYGITVAGVPILYLPSLVLVVLAFKAWAPAETFLARVCLAAATTVIAIALTFTVLPTGWGTTMGFILAAAFEEATFRFAAPVLVALVLHRLGLRARLSAAAGFVAAGTWFVYQPGHLGQIPEGLAPLTGEGIVGLVGFALFAAGFTWFVWYARMVLPAVMLHASYNLLILGEKLGVMESFVRTLVFAVLVAAVAVVALHYRSPRLRAYRERLARARADTEPVVLVSS